jgi:hypothetical protein
VDRTALPTYLPGDAVRVSLEIQHRGNLRDATARFNVHPEREGAVPFPVELRVTELETLEVSTDGAKTSRAIFGFETETTNIEPGAVFELRNISAEAIGRQSVVFDLSGVEAFLFRYAPEPSDDTPVVRHASTERL